MPFAPAIRRTFPIVAALLLGVSLSACGSGLSLTAGGTEVELTDFVIDPGDSTLTGTVSVDGKEAATDALLFDLDGRTYTYTVETSEDGNTWEPAADHRADPVHGWQADVFSPRAARFLRLTGLTNSTGQPLMQVVEFEAYPAG